VLCSVQFRYSGFLYCFWECHEWFLAPYLHLLALGHAAAFVVNAALMASRWQHRAWIVSPISPQARVWTGHKYRFSSLCHGPAGNRTEPTSFGCT